MAKNFLEKTVRFNIQRKPALADSLLPYKIYINGQYVGALKNGRTISAEVPRAEIYYIDGGSFEQNAVIRNENKAEYNLVLRTRGGWRTEAHCEFYICADAQMQQLPSFHFDKLFDAIFNENIERLPHNEQTLALCLEFWNDIVDDVQELLASERVYKIIDSLREIGADKIADVISDIIEKYFSGVQLPLNDEQLEQMYGSVNKANKNIWENKSAQDEFHDALVRYIVDNFNDRKYIY